MAADETVRHPEFSRWSSGDAGPILAAMARRGVVADGYSLEPGWSLSYHTRGWGRKGGGAWKPCRYRVEVTAGGAHVASGELEIVAARR